MDYYQDIHLTLAVSAEQLDTINHLFTHYNWTYREISRTERNFPESSHPRHSNISDVSTQTESMQAEGDPGGEPYVISQNQEETECPYCLCRPCITNEQNRQLWWETENHPLSQRNTGMRIEKYKRFWTMMFHREVWKDPRYLAEKTRVLQRDRRFRTNFTWHRRDIMPKCVLELVRGWFPNPPAVSYLGHLWE